MKYSLLWSAAHNRITANLIREIDTLLLDGPCVTYNGDQRVKVTATGLYTYPDVMIVCGEARYDSADPDTLLNPTVLIEVLSPSTEAYDRGAKFAHYRSLDSLREYLLVAQDRPRVERYVRRGEVWELSTHEGPDATFPLGCVEEEVPLAGVYNRVALPENPGR